MEAIVTREMVFEAANRLAASGQKVTARSLLDDIGGGSLKTVHNFYREWRQELLAERQAQITTRESVTIPENIRETAQGYLDRIRIPFDQMLAVLWQEAMGRAQAELEEAKAAAAKQIEEAQTERDEILSDLEKLMGEKKELGKEAQELRAQVEGLKPLEQEVAVQKERILQQGILQEQMKEQYEKDIQDATREAEELRAQVEALKPLTQEVAVLNERLVQQGVLQEQLKEQYEKQLQDGARERDRLAADLDKAKVFAATTKAERDQKAVELERETERTRKLEMNVQRLEGDVNDFKARMVKAEARSFEMDKQVKLMQDQIRDLKAQRDQVQAAVSAKEEEQRTAKASKPKKTKQSRGKSASELLPEETPAE
jgi:chromosome segregation ATPase